jgi:CRISPR-associated endoribonuclease Cas6
MENYHHKLRGRIWQALQGSKFDEEHGADDPVGFAFSNPFPPGDLEPGDTRTLLISSVHEDLLTLVARDLNEHPDLELGSMLFEVDEMSVIEPDVGEPGTRGTIETGTGVLVRITPEHRERYGIDGDGSDEVTFWRPEHSMEPFKDAIRANLQHKHDLFARDHLPGPEDAKTPLFDGYELLKTFALPVDVTTNERRTLILSKWRFDYTVQNDDHRRWLNLALDCGIGGRNGLGFGFVNIVEDSVIPASETARESIAGGSD